MAIRYNTSEGFLTEAEIKAKNEEDRKRREAIYYTALWERLGEKQKAEFIFGRENYEPW